MRHLVIAASITFTTGLSAQTPLSLQAKPLRDSLLISVLNGAEMEKLESDDLALRLYRVARSGSCVAETHWVCSYRYVLAVSEYDEHPNQAVFDLGEVGEIGNIRSLPGAHSDQALLELEVRNYPTHAVKQNTRLTARVKRYRLDVTVQRVLTTAIE